MLVATNQKLRRKLVFVKEEMILPFQADQMLAFAIDNPQMRSVQLVKTEQTKICIDVFHIQRAMWGVGYRVNAKQRAGFMASVRNFCNFID